VGREVYSLDDRINTRGGRMENKADNEEDIKICLNGIV